MEQHLFTKSTVALSSTKLALQISLSTNYKLYFIFVYKKYFFHAKRLNLPVYFLVGIFISTLM